MISGGELVVIFIVALLVFGPQRLPELGRTIGKVMREVRKAMDDVKEQVNTEYEKTEKETKDEAAKLPIEGKMTEDKTEAEDKGKV